MTSPARGGPDTAGMRETAREEIARIVYDRDSFAGDLHWSRTAPTERDRCRAIADAILALPVVQRLAVEKAAEAVALAQIRTILAAGSNPRSTVEAIRRALAAAAQPTDGRTGE